MKKIYASQWIKSILFILPALLFVFVNKIKAQTPQYAFTVGTSTANSIPFGSTSNRRQMIYYPSNFGATMGGTITKIYIKASAVVSCSFSDFTILMGQTTLSNFTAGPYITTGLDTVFYAPTFAVSSTATGNWIVVTLQKPYYYNNISNFIFDASQSAYSPGFSGAYATTGVTARSLYGTRTAATASLQDRLVQFGFDFAPTFPYNNASISSLVSPVNFCAGSRDIKVKLRNGGKNRIDSVNVQWRLDGVLQTPIHWTSPLDTVGSSLYPNDTTIFLGNVPFISGTARTLSVWSEYPNNVADTLNVDDTLNVILKSSLSGTYTIGGTTPDYPTFTDAVYDLNNYGVCGPVIFNVRPGTYTERITINQVAGSSAINNIIFAGSGKTTTTITNTGTSTADHATILLNGTDYTTFRDMTIASAGLANGVGILLTNAADSNFFRNLFIQMNPASTATTSAGVSLTGSTTTLTTTGNSGNRNLFDSLDIDGAYYGISMYGTGSTSFLTGNIISNCRLTNQYTFGITVYYSSELTISKNIISLLRSTTAYGIRDYYCSNYTIDNNNIQTPYYGLYSYYSNYYLYNSLLKTNVINNMIAGGTSYALYNTTNSNMIRYLHNSFISSGTTATTYFTTITGIDFRNNIVVNTNTGANSVMYVTTTGTFDSLDYNNYYSMGSGFITGTVYASLSAWKTALPQYNSNSYAVNPLFVSSTDLHFQKNSPVISGVNVGIITDIDGQRRPTPPSVGADEKSKQPNSAGIKALVSPVNFCAGTQNVKVRIANNGNNLINTVNIAWELNGVPQTGAFWSNPIDTFESLAGNDTVVTLGSSFFTQGVSSTIKAWTYSPNGVNDSVNVDDTIWATVKPAIAAGTYTIGTTGTYTSLTAALADLQYGVCGPVIFELQTSYTSTGETFPLTIGNIPGASATNKIIIRPQTGATALSISSSNAFTTIDLAGAKYMVIDGRPGGVGNNELTITNTSATGSAIRFINDAQNDTLRYLTVIGNNTTAASGVVVFGTASGGNTTNGNNANIIDRCNINGNSASVNCLYSQGSAAPADNKNNTITNCNIYDFFSNVAGANVCGISLAGGNSGWNIGMAGNGNNFYQTAARTPASTPALTAAVFFKAVFINDASVNGTSITGNRMGGNIPGIAGSTFVIGNGATPLGHTLRVIDNYVSGTTSPTSIQGNTISDIIFYSTITNSFIGIHGRQGFVNTGNITGNIIGATTGTGSIQIFHVSTTTGANSYGIRYEAANGAIQNNSVGSMTAEVQNATGSMQLLCIYLTGAYTAPVVVSNNLVGSLTTPNSIQSTATSIGGVNIMGLVASAASGASITFSNNMVTNLTSFCNVAGTSNGLKGIYITGASSVGTTVSGNTVSKLYSASTNPGIDQTSAVLGINTSSTGAGSQVISNNIIHTLGSTVSSAVAVNVVGIYYGSSTTGSGSLIEKNLVHSLSTSATNTLALQNGIVVGAGTTRVSISNNMVSLGYDSAGASITGPASITGILRSGGLASCFFNTVAIGGAGVNSTAMNTFAYRRTAAGIDSLMNNIFINTRSNATTGGTHYSIGLDNAISLTTNYNLYYVGGTALGLFNSVNQTALTDLRNSTAQDSNSVSLNPVFISNTNLHLDSTMYGNMNLKGTSVAGISTDFDGHARTVTPYMGADEIPGSPLPVHLLDFTGTVIGKDVILQWSTASEFNNSGFNIERSTNGKDFKQIMFVKSGNSTRINKYSTTDKDAFTRESATTLYYRLKDVGVTGKENESGKIITVNSGDVAGINIAVYPNPFNNDLTLSFVSLKEGNASIVITDLQGRLITTKVVEVKEGNNKFSVEENELQTGIYFMNILLNGENNMMKLIKQ